MSPSELFTPRGNQSRTRSSLLTGRDDHPAPPKLAMSCSGSCKLKEGKTEIKSTMVPKRSVYVRAWSSAATGIEVYLSALK